MHYSKVNGETSFDCIYVPQQYYVMNTNGLYSGAHIDLLNILAEEMGFTYSVILPAIPQWGVKLSNGSWTGIISDLAEGRADIGLSLFSISESRMSVVDYTPYIDIVPYVIVSSANPPTKSASLHEAFSSQVWICLMISLLAFAMLLCFISYAKRGTTHMLTVPSITDIAFSMVVSHIRQATQYHKILDQSCGKVMMFMGHHKK